MFRNFTCVICGRSAVVADWIKGDTCSSCEFAAHVAAGGYDD